MNLSATLLSEDPQQQQEEPTTALTTTDICTQINLISSIQYQQNELSILAKLLQSEKDREKYIKVIEMSKIIQSKLDGLQDEKKKTNVTIKNQRINSFGQHLDKKNSMWSLNNRHHYDSYYSSSSSSSSSSNSSRSSTASSQTSEHTISNIIGHGGSNAFNNSKNFVSNDDILFATDHSSPSRYHTYNEHSYRVIDRVTSLQFIPQSDSVYNSRRPSADTILVDLCLKKEKVFVKPATSLPHRKSKRISFAAAAQPPPPPPTDSDDEEEVLPTKKAIHVAVVRKDASLFKIEKISNNHHKGSLTVAAITTTSPSPSPSPSSTSISPTIPISRPHHHPLEKVATAVKKKRVSFSDEKRKDRVVTAGLLTPPDSPQSTQNQYTTIRPVHSDEEESYLDLNITHPQIIHVQKKTHQSLKGLLKRTYQLNQYKVTKTNSTTLPFSNGILYKTFNAMNGKPKLLLKIIVVSLDIKSSEKQKRFGFTFWWKYHHQEMFNNSGEQQDDAKFALAPDSLVKEALVTWIEFQNEEVALLPSLSQSDEILRDGRKIYVVYDTSLF